VIGRIRARRRRAGGDREAGITLVELLAAMVVFGIVAAATVAGLATALKTTRLDKNRVQASSLAAREVEVIRNTFNSGSSGVSAIAGTTYVVNPNPLPGGTAGQPIAVDGVPYTVVRNVQWMPAGSGQSACDGGSAVTYPSLAVNVTVTWPSMGNVQPVQSNTILTPPKGTLATNLGFVAVKIVDVKSAPVASQTVTLTGPGGTQTDTTAADGCAVFATSKAGSYSASVSTSGYTDFYGNAVGTSSNINVTAGSITQRTITYDKAASLTITLSTDAGYALPTGKPNVTLGNTNIQPTGTMTVATSGATTTVPGLWPFGDGYSVWAGACVQSDPAAAGGTRNPATVIAPGGSATASVRLAPVSVTVTNRFGFALTNATVTATPASTTGCASSENPLTLGVTDATGTLATSLPAGAWTIKVNGTSAYGSWPTTPVLLPDSAATTVAVATS
jgi:type II secretory pathway pseudopilin PulG